MGKLPIGESFQRKEILKEVSEKEQKAFDSFIRRIKRLGIIKGTEVRGEYRFVSQLYHLYVLIEAFRAEKEKEIM